MNQSARASEASTLRRVRRARAPVVRMEVERIERARLVAPWARGELHLLDDVGDARHDCGLDDLAAGRIERGLGHVALGIDRPGDDEVSLDSGMILEPCVVTSARIVAPR